MRRLAFFAPILLLAGCMEQEPLAPAFAGKWASARGGCSGPRITINKGGISASGMPIDGLSFSSAKVSGATAHLVMEMSPAARLVMSAQAGRQKESEIKAEDIEVAATLIASGSRVHPSNVIMRHKKTRQIQAVDPNVLAIMTLIRCEERRTS